MTKRNKTKIIACLLCVIAVLAIIYFVADNRIRNTLHPVSTSTPIQGTVESTKQYVNEQYGFSLTYPAQDTIEELPYEVTFWKGDKSRNLWDIAVYAEPITQIDPTLTDPSGMVTRMNNEAIGLGYKQVIDKHISIDGYSAIVTSQINTAGSSTPVAPEKQVFFIKDKLLFTIFTNAEDDALWNSFKFNK